MKIGKIIAVLVSTVLLAGILCIPAAAAKAGISFAKASATVAVGKTITLKPKVTGISKYTLEWSSDNKKICTVDSKGKVRGISEGTAVVTAKVKGKKLSAKCSITVKDTSSSSKGFDKKITGTELVKNMRSGFNIGNSLDAFSGNNIGNSGLSSETCWGNPKISEKYIQMLRDKGFSTVRIPVTWHNHMDPLYNIDEQWMARVKEVVDYAVGSGMYVIINMHHDNSVYDIKTAIASASDYKIIEQRFVRAWSQIGRTFAGYDEHLIFESMNEPRIEGSASEWIGGTPEERKIVNDLNAAFVKEIRSQGGNNKYRFLMLPCYAASSSDNALNDMKFPSDKRVILSVHAYSPYNFAMNKDGSSAFTEQDKNELDRFFGVLNDKFIKKGIPVVIGEMGATNKDNLSDRTAWAEYYVKKARKYGIACLWWDNGAYNVGEENFGLINRFSNKFVFESIADAMVKNSK